LGAAAVGLDLDGLAPRGWRAEGEDRGAAAGLAGAPGVDADVRERLDLLGLLLRAHDPLEGRVARLVERVGDAEHRRQRGADLVVAELRLALGGGLAVGDLELGDLADDRHPQAVGNGGPEYGPVA